MSPKGMPINKIKWSFSTLIRKGKEPGKSHAFMDAQLLVLSLKEGIGLDNF